MRELIKQVLYFRIELCLASYHCSFPTVTSKHPVSLQSSVWEHVKKASLKSRRLVTNKKQQQRQYTAAHKTAALVHFSGMQHWKGIYHLKKAQYPWKEERCLTRPKNSMEQEFWREWVGYQP